MANGFKDASSQSIGIQEVVGCHYSADSKSGSSGSTVNNCEKTSYGDTFFTPHEDPCLFPQVVNCLVEFLVDAIGQTSGDREP